MTISAISDTAISALHRALDGLDIRQQATATNIANLETPGYQARVVSFEDSLRAAALDGHPGSASISMERSLAPTRMNGNNVNIDFELLEGSETQLRQQMITQGLTAKYGMLRTAITGR